jgi:hypothetical protein
VFDPPVHLTLVAFSKSGYIQSVTSLDL